MVQRSDLIKLQKKAGWAPATVILGPRQCGKTTIAKEFASTRSEGFVYLDIESPSDQAKLSDPESFFKFNEDKLVIIDEIQIMPGLYSILRSVIDRNRRNGRFLLLGSASPNLVQGVTETLAGRVSFLEMRPFSLTEIQEQYNWKQHWLKGGFPQAFLSESMDAWKDWMEAFIKTYIERDFRILFNIEINSVIISKLWQMLAYNQGNQWNADLYARSLGITAPTAVRYLDLLEGAFLVRKLSPWMGNVNKRVAKSPKIYLNDSGLVHFMNRVTDMEMLQSHPIVGASWEGYVIQQIYCAKNDDIDLYYYRTHNGAELDLVLAKADKPIAGIEIKYSNAPSISKGFYISCEDLATQKNFVITPGSDTYPAQNCTVCNLQDFINKYLKEI